MIKRLPFKLPLVVLIVLLAMSTFWLDLAVKPPSTGVEQDGSARRDPDYVLENSSVMRMSQDGVARDMLFVKKLLHYPDTNSGDLEQPRLVKTNPCVGPSPSPDPGKPVVQIQANQSGRSDNVYLIKADQGELFGRSTDVYLTGNVTVQREAGDGRDKATLVTSSLHIIPDADIAKTDKPVTITTGSIVVDAIGMELNDCNRAIQLLSEVKIVYNKTR